LPTRSLASQPHRHRPATPLGFFIAAFGIYVSCHHPTFYSRLLHPLQTTRLCHVSSG